MKLRWKTFREPEGKYRMLIEHSLQGIAVIQGAPLRFVFANSSWANIFGYTLNELTSLSAKEIEGLVYPEDRAMVFERLAGRLKGKSVPSHYEIRGLRKDGAVIWLELSASQIESNGQPAVQVEAIDRTRYKKAETELFENNMRLQNILAASPDAITITDLRGNIVDCNQAAVSLGGFSSREELIGKSALELMAKRDHQRAVENLKITAEKGLLRNVSYTLMRKDGHEYPAELSASVVRDTQGNLVGFVAILRDITERKEMQRELEEYSQQLEKMVEQRTKQLRDTQEQLVKAERLAAIGQVAAMVGHDLRNPLTGISGAAYYLKMKLGPKAEKKMTQMLEIIEKDIQYSNKIITDLMDYSREIKLELTETTPKSIIAESISLIQIPEKVQLADSTLNEPKIKIDIDKTKRVFANFVKNAVEAMPQGGKLTISSRASSNNVEFMLIDSGVGMTKEVSEKIWTPFFTTKAKGMGLGLAICKRIVEAHQGKISVESIVGEGTTFTITIPIEPRIRVEGGERVWVNMPESLLSTTTKA
jgi:two-component system sensor kinase FixL